MKPLLHRGRIASGIKVLCRRPWSGAAGALLLGAALGFLAKALDGTPVLGDIGTNLGVWIFVATLLAAWSPSPKAAALRVPVFFVAMLAAYYLYSTVLFGAFPQRYFLLWGRIALASPLAAVVAWHGRGRGWPAALCAALPIALLALEGYRFFYTGDLAQAFDLLAGLGLLAALAAGVVQKLRVLGLTAVFAFVFQQAHLFALIFRGF